MNILFIIHFFAGFMVSEITRVYSTLSVFSYFPLLAHYFVILNIDEFLIYIIII